MRFLPLVLGMLVQTSSAYAGQTYNCTVVDSASSNFELNSQFALSESPDDFDQFGFLLTAETLGLENVRVGVSMGGVVTGHDVLHSIFLPDGKSYEFFLRFSSRDGSAATLTSLNGTPEEKIELLCKIQ